jgi:hypothetical protein
MVCVTRSILIVRGTQVSRFMKKSWRLWAAVGGAVVVLGAIIALFIADALAPKNAAPLPLTETFDDSPTGFSFMYPGEWDYIIPMIGVLVTGPPQTLYEGVPGPTFTVHRLNPLSVLGSLDEALQGYLDSGPLRVPGRWQVTAPASTIVFEGRDARVVELRGSDAEGGAPMHTRMVITAADNTFVYVFITTVPADGRTTYEQTLQAMLDTVRILE